MTTHNAARIAISTTSKLPLGTLADLESFLRNAPNVERRDRQDMIAALSTLARAAKKPLAGAPLGTSASAPPATPSQPSAPLSFELDDGGAKIAERTRRAAVDDGSAVLEQQSGNRTSCRDAGRGGHQSGIWAGGNGPAAALEDF